MACNQLLSPEGSWIAAVLLNATLCHAVVLQGVLKAATLPDGATWLLVSPDHQQYVLVSSSRSSSACLTALLQQVRQHQLVVSVVSAIRLM